MKKVPWYFWVLYWTIFGTASLGLLILGTVLGPFFGFGFVMRAIIEAAPRQAKVFSQNMRSGRRGN